jgi:hypothetical protein
MTDDRAGTRSRGSSLASRCLGWLPYLSLCGLGGLAANLMLSFEEPQRGLLMVAGLLLFAAPVGMLTHLALTSELTPTEKRLWGSALASRKGPTVFRAYFSTRDRARVTRQLSVTPPSA